MPKAAAGSCKKDGFRFSFMRRARSFGLGFRLRGLFFGAQSFNETGHLGRDFGLRVSGLELREAQP